MTSISLSIYRDSCFDSKLSTSRPLEVASLRSFAIHLNSLKSFSISFVLKNDRSYKKVCK